MCYWDDGDYFEPGEFDEKIEELKNIVNALTAAQRERS